jgi:hypothetical protein
MTPKGAIIVHHMNEAALRSHQAQRDDALSRRETLFAELKLMRCGSETRASPHEVEALPINFFLTCDATSSSTF